MVAGTSGGMLVTRPLTWAASKKKLFVNCDGGLAVELLSGSGTVIMKSSVVAVNSTRSEIQWDHPASETGGVNLAPGLPAATAAAPLRVRFALQPKARLYSFWVSANGCGSSGGVVAGGGPGFDSSRDVHGSCAGR